MSTNTQESKLHPPIHGDHHEASDALMAAGGEKSCQQWLAVVGDRRPVVGRVSQRVLRKVANLCKPIGS